MAQIEMNSKAGVGSFNVTFDSKLQAPSPEHIFKGRSESLCALAVPMTANAVVNVQCEDGSIGLELRHALTFHEEAAERALRCEAAYDCRCHHGPSTDGVAEVEFETLAHG